MNERSSLDPVLDQEGVDDPYGRLWLKKSKYREISAAYPQDGVCVPTAHGQIVMIAVIPLFVGS